MGLANVLFLYHLCCFLQTGYLLKLSGSMKPNNLGPVMWKRRYFMLRGCTFTYYSDHHSMQDPKGELLIFGESKMTTCELSGQKFCITLMNPFPVLHLACETNDDMQLWVKAFTKSIALAKKGLRNYMIKYSNPSEGPSKRKYFILHQDAVTIHKDMESISVVQGTLPSHLPHSLTIH